MEATFVVDLDKDQEFVRRFAQFFAGKKLKITVQEVYVDNIHPDGQELFRQLEEIRKQTEAVPVPPIGDVNALIDEMNNTKMD
jgi:hypothetical protein